MRTIYSRLMIASLIVAAVSFMSCGGGGSTPPAGTTASYYVDSAGGNDSNSGTNSSAPWQTMAKVTSSLPANSTIYLKRGSVWYEQLTIPSSGITVDAYGTGALPKLDGSTLVTVWNDEGSGLYSSGTITVGTGEALGNLSENGSMMRFLAWDSDMATTFSGAALGSYSYDQGAAKLYIKPASPPSGSTYRASIGIFGITATDLSDIAVRNIEITRFSLHGIHFKDCTRCSAADSVVSRIGGAMIAPNLYAGNGIEFGNSSSDGAVDNVTISEIFDSGITPQTYASDQTLSSIRITNSLVQTCGFAGIEVSVLDNGGTTNSAINDILISGVTVSGSGTGWSGQRYGIEGNGIRVQADDGAGTMSGIRIEQTTVRGSVGDGIKLGGEIGTVMLHRLDITGNTYGIELSEPTATGIGMQLTSSLIHHNMSWGIAYNAPAAAGFELQQDTFADNGVINLGVQDWSASGSAVVRNNLFYGSSAMAHLYSAVTLTGAAIDNNCYTELTNMFGYGSNVYSTVAAFRSATGFEANGIGGDVGLAAPASGDFTLLNTSACKTLGSTTAGVAEDYSGYPFANPPSSGAYQYR